MRRIRKKAARTQKFGQKDDFGIGRQRHVRFVSRYNRFWLLICYLAVLNGWAGENFTREGCHAHTELTARPTMNRANVDKFRLSCERLGRAAASPLWAARQGNKHGAKRLPVDG